jgi:leader peptidase (prepilin peptidase)/N-methyltransferase
MMEWLTAAAYAYLAVISIALIIIDVRSKRLPNSWTLPAYPILLTLFGVSAAMGDRWPDLFRATLGSLITVVTLFLIASFSANGFGMGDVKLAGVFAIPLAWQSWSALILGIAGAFILSAFVSLILLALRRVNRASLIPFGPFLIVSAWLVIVLT